MDERSNRISGEGVQWGEMRGEDGLHSTGTLIGNRKLECTLQESKSCSDLGRPSHSSPLLIHCDQPLGPEQLRLHIDQLALGGVAETDPLSPPLPLPLPLPLQQHLQE